MKREMNMIVINKNINFLNNKWVYMDKWVGKIYMGYMGMDTHINNKWVINR